MTKIMIVTLEGKDYVSPDFLMEKFNISRKTVTNYTNRGLFPAPIRIGRNLFYSREYVESGIIVNVEQ
jgi:predicted DNA-binding transcriptional regulator AlpA